MTTKSKLLLLLVLMLLGLMIKRYMNNALTVTNTTSTPSTKEVIN